MKPQISAFILLTLQAGSGTGAVFLNEIAINPPGGLDNTQEFVEIVGPPGMKLDGYAVAAISGTQRKYYEFGTVPPVPAVHPEIDELFSLDGLQLGANGILVIGRGINTDYGAMLADTSFHTWSGEPPVGLWNGYNDFTGGFENDASLTFVLIRNRPGAQSGGGPTFTPPPDLRWGKDTITDGEIEAVEYGVCFDGPAAGEPCNAAADCGVGGTCQTMHCAGGPTPGIACTNDGQCGAGGTCTPTLVTALGDGSVDEGDPIGGVPGNTLDCKGQLTPGVVDDDLEVVDEVGYEDAQGWKYDFDARHVDIGSTHPALQERRVHTLDDPQGFNPDYLTRVDYRTKGNGWTPVGGATGEMLNGNNWQDTATQQWIRGDALTGTGGQGSNPQIFYDVGANTDPNALQPYRTHVPLWLNDGSGTEFNFTTANSYQIMAGRANPLAVPFIPGDVDRDGVCNSQDIVKLGGVFGNDNWIFSNSFAGSPEGNSGDPSEQFRPWDMDLTGDNGIEASDMQWVLNFQGNTTGRIVGVAYDSTTPTPLGQGVVLNPNTGVSCTATTSILSLSGRPITGLKVGDLVQITIRAQVTGGVNNTAGQQNGIMQYVMDLRISVADRLRVIEETSLAPFTSTRAIQALLGTSPVGERGIGVLNGYTTSFTSGLAAPVALNRVTLQAIGLGSATVTLSQATSDPKFNVSTPHGLKVGHTSSYGNPASSSYPAPLAFIVTGSVRPDFDGDGHVTAGAGGDLEHLIDCRSGAEIPQEAPACLDARLDSDEDVDLDDFAIFQRYFSGEEDAPPQNCDLL
jgi:hypothetical protein